MLPESSVSMKWIKAAEFEMGSADPKKKDSEPAHRVKLSRGYWMASYETTQSQFRKLMGDDASRFNGSPHLPVDHVSHHDASVYCERLTEVERKAGRLPSDYIYRLPTEAEWEYACRAGSSNDFSVPEAKFWRSGTSQEQTHEVGTSEPNAWGLYDMSGNVWEWCYDGFGPYSKWESLSTDPLFLTKIPESHVVRGGAWWTAAQDCRSTRRDQSTGDGFVGFRIVLAAKFKPGVGVWFHLDDRHVFLPNGRIDSPDSSDTWSLTGQELILRWKRDNAPTGHWIDTCTLSVDGRSFQGGNQAGGVVRGNKLPDY